MNLTLKQIAEKSAALDGELAVLLEKDVLTSDEENRLSEIEAEQKELEQDRSRAERKDRLEKEMKDRESWGKQLASKPADVIKDVTAVASVRDRVLADPAYGFKSYNDFALAVKRAFTPGDSFVHENLRIIKAAYGNNEETGAEGGFLIPPEYSNRIVERSVGSVPAVEQCDKLVLTGNMVRVNGFADHDQNDATYRHGGVVVYWVGEGNQITRSSLKFRQITLTPHKMAALSFVTEEELTDVANFGQRLLDKQSLAIADELLEAIMFGTGVGQPLGALVGTSPCVEVAAETGQDADTIVAENIIKMNSVIYTGSRGKGNWYYNGECLPQLETMVIQVGTGGVPVFMPPGGLSVREYGMLKGRPAYETDHCAALGDAGDIAFADWSQYMLALKGSVNTAMSIHLRFDYAETAFRSLFRVDGRPSWDSNLKPRKGASTRRVSPFVKLAARA